MKLILKEKYFFFICDYNQKDIPKKYNFKFNAEGKIWWTKSALNAYHLRNYANENLKNKLEKYYKKRQVKIKESFSDYANINIPKPDGIDYFPFQKAGIKYALERENTLIADDMGLGKTIQIAGIINSLDNPKNILIVCPNTLKLNWKQELEKWLVHKNLTYSVNSMTEFSYADIMIINYEAFRYVSNKASKKFKDPADGNFNPTFHLMKDLQKIKKFDLLVLDESHKIKNWSSNTTRNIFKLKKKVERTVFLTGTPIMGKIEELWTTIKFFNLQKVFGRNKNEFMKKWCGAYWNPFMRRYESDPTQISEETYKRFQENLRIHFMIRRTKKQVLKELPEKIRSIVPVEIDRSQLKEFEHLSQDVVDATSMNSNHESSVFSSLQPSQIEELTELRQLSGNLKVQPAYEFIKDILSNDEKVVVFAHHVSVLENIYKKFRKHAVLVRGGISADERHDAVTKFQNDPNIKVFVGQNDTASLGLTLTASNNIVIIESSWTPSVNLQIEDRLLRIGQENTVNVYYLVADKTLDAHIISTVIKKQKLFEKVIEKDNIL